MPAPKTIAQLTLEELLQGANPVSGAPAQTKLASLPTTKGRDAKPRLLLMGLRRYVCLTTFKIQKLTVFQEWQVFHRQCSFPQDATK